jgi:hypothetical protein
VDFKFSAYVAFQVHDQKIAKPNNQKSLGVKDNSKDISKVSKVGYDYSRFTLGVSNSKGLNKISKVG